jgi:hypothetical protein
MNIRDPRVYVVQDPEGKEIADARSFGTIRVILTGRESTSQAITVLQSTLKDFQEQDFLLLVGRSINMGLAVHLALTQTGGVLNLLVWHREHWAYTKETINIKEQNGDWSPSNQSVNTTTPNQRRTRKSSHIGE